MDNNIGQTVEATGTIAEQKTSSQKSVQAVCESESWGSQHSPINNNNNGDCCDAQSVAHDEAQQNALEINDNGDCSDSQTELATSTDDFRGQHIPQEYRQGVLDIEEWLSDAVTDTPENFQGMLNVAIEYLRLVPEAKKWLWEQLKGEVKTLMWQLFPDYIDRSKADGRMITVDLEDNDWEDKINTQVQEGHS